VALEAKRAAESPWVEGLARFGIVAQGVSFMLVGALAVKLALGEGGKATDRHGALRTLAQDGFGRLAVIALAIGFGAYALWRLAQVFLGHDVEEPGAREKMSKRLTSLGKAALYGILCAVAVSILIGEKGNGNEEEDATKGILGWPGGRWIVAAIAVAIAAAALWNFYRAVSGQYKDSLKKEEMSAAALRWTTRIAFAGLMARAVVFGIVSWFFFNAAADYNANKARGLDGALRKLTDAPYGKWLLGIVAAGLFAYGLFCLIQAKYREV
jgi:formate hydrogenlyase subunit 3/multisubunit Na+/H+ antiporter MnhD subunit